MSKPNIELSLIRSKEFRSLDRSKKRAFLDDYKEKYYQIPNKIRKKWWQRDQNRGLVIKIQNFLSGISEDQDIDQDIDEDIIEEKPLTIKQQLLQNSILRNQAFKAAEKKMADKYPKTDSPNSNRNELKLAWEKKKFSLLTSEYMEKEVQLLLKEIEVIGQEHLFKSDPYQVLLKIKKLIPIFKDYSPVIPPIFGVKYLENGKIKSNDIRKPTSGKRTDTYRNSYQQYMNSCLEKAMNASIITYSDIEEELVVTYNQDERSYFSSTVVFMHPQTATKLGIDIESTALQFIEITLPIKTNCLYPKKYFSILPNPNVLEGGIQLPKQYTITIVAGTCVQVKQVKQLPNPITVFVYHQFLGQEYNSTFVQMGLDTMNQALAKDEFQMQKTVLSTGEIFNVMGAGGFSITRIWAENPNGGPPFEVPAVGLQNEFDVEIIFKRIPKIFPEATVKEWIKSLSEKLEIIDIHGILIDAADHYLATNDLMKLHDVWIDNSTVMEDQIKNVHQLIYDTSKLYQCDTSSLLRKISSRFIGSNNLVTLIETFGDKDSQTCIHIALTELISS